MKEGSSNLPSPFPPEADPALRRDNVYRFLGARSSTDRALASEAKGCAFNSHRAHQPSPLAGLRPLPTEVGHGRRRSAAGQLVLTLESIYIKINDEGEGCSS